MICTPVKRQKSCWLFRRKRRKSRNTESRIRSKNPSWRWARHILSASVYTNTRTEYKYKNWIQIQELYTNTRTEYKYKIQIQIQELNTNTRTEYRYKNWIQIQELNTNTDMSRMRSEIPSWNYARHIFLKHDLLVLVITVADNFSSPNKQRCQILIFRFQMSGWKPL